MARKRKSNVGATEEYLWRPEDLAYVKWMNAELASGRPTTKPLRNVHATGSTPAQSTVNPHRTQGPHVTDYDTDEDFPEKDSEDEDLEQGSDGEHPVAAWHGDVQYNGPAEQTANATHAVRDGADPSPHARAKRNGKAKAQPESPNETSVSGIAQKGQRLEWSPKESTVLVAARWFTKDELQQMTGKQGSQYWLRLIERIKLQHPDWSRNALACTNQWKRLKALWKQIDKGDSASGGGTVIKPPWWEWMVLFYKDTAAAEPHALDGGGAVKVNVDPGVKVTATMAVAQLLSDTLKQCSADGVAQITGVIREWMATQQSQTSRPLHFSGSRHGDDDSWHYNREGSEGNTNADLSDGVEEWRRGDDA
ncbi:unnamed protein product [Closterium sp. NIES-64]|nr:unnamed protein product [Closterium sp. NIES-64]